jgi:hypothetical protein
LDNNLFDIDTAIKVCRELTHYDLALKLAEQRKECEYYLSILVEDMRDE